jgi:hypothetical protein
MSQHPERQEEQSAPCHVDRPERSRDSRPNHGGIGRGYRRDQPQRMPVYTPQPSRPDSASRPDPRSE